VFWLIQTFYINNHGITGCHIQGWILQQNGAVPNISAPFREALTSYPPGLPLCQRRRARERKTVAKRVSGIYGQWTAGVTASCSNNSGFALTASVDGAVIVNAELNSAEYVNLWSTVIETCVSAVSIRRQQN